MVVREMETVITPAEPLTSSITSTVLSVLTVLTLTLTLPEKGLEF